MINKSFYPAFLFISLATYLLYAAPANPGLILRHQPDGSSFMARARGDEFFGWHETGAGFPIEKNPATGWWVYRLRPGDTSSTIRVVGIDEPSGRPWAPEPSAPSIQMRLSRSSGSMDRIPLGGEHGASSLGVGEAKLLTACVRFTNSPPESSLTPISYFQHMIYGRTTDRRTVADYYHDVSGGKLSITGEVRGWVTMPLSSTYYGNNADGIINQERVANMISNTVTSLRTSGFNFGSYDSDLDGFVDCLAIVFQGLGEADGGDENTIWPHQFTYSQLNGAAAKAAPLATGSVNAEGEPVFIDLYFTAAELNTRSSNAAETVSAPIGTFCHEFAHALGLPDLYDTLPPQSLGLGQWSLMAYGTYANGYGQNGDCPVWIDPYNRLMMGWDEEIHLTNSLITARIPEAQKERFVYRLWKDGVENHEYFLVEYRRRHGFNVGQPGEGLLIYHIDESITTGNNYAWYKLPDGRALIGKFNYLVALEQADGLFEIERAIDQGDDQDAFKNGQEFTDTSWPGSKAYNDWGTFDDGPSTLVAVKNINIDSPDVAYADLHIFADQERPGISIQTPAGGALIDVLSAASGSASDNVNVTSISATLQELRPGGRYYDWANSAWTNVFSASCVQSVTPSSSWSLPVNDAIFTNGEAYRLTAIAQDAAGLTTESTSDFTFDRLAYSPTIAISSPAGETYAVPPLIQGSASTPGETLLTSRRFAIYSESSNAWYSWSSQSFAPGAFDFNVHVTNTTGSETSWNEPLPANLVSGLYQVHAQSVNNSNRASPWALARFRLARAPTVSIASHVHQSLLNSLGTLSGYAAPQAGYSLDGFVNLTVYREGQYWTGSYWTNTQATLLASVNPSGGSWSWPGPGTGDLTLPADDGLYAISASVIDNYGSWSLSVAGGAPGQNNILLRVDNTPPDLRIHWPPAGYTSTVSSIPAYSFAGSATDRSGQPIVRGYIRRVSDGLYWSVYGWVYAESQGMFTAGYPGGDGGSFSEWKLDPYLPAAGASTLWCMPNGEYELIAVAFDITGNSNRLTRTFTVNYQNPLFTNLPYSGFAPTQMPLNTTPFELMAATSAPSFSTTAEAPESIQRVFPVSNHTFRMTGKRLKSVSYGVHASEPVFYAAGLSGKLHSTIITGSIEYATSQYYERNAGAPVVDFRTDGEGISVSELMEYGYRWYHDSPYDPFDSAYDWNPVNQCQITRIGADGSMQWQVLVPSTNYTGWLGTADPAGLNVKWTKLLDDGRAVVIAELFANRVQSYAGYQLVNYRKHILCMVLNTSGQVLSANRFGTENEDEELQENESLIDATVDNAGHLFIASQRTAGSRPTYHLRKIRLSDGEITGEYIMDVCTSPEKWATISVDSAGWVYIGASVAIEDQDHRLLVTRIHPITMSSMWRAYGPTGSMSQTANNLTPANMPLLRAGTSGVYVVHNHEGTDTFSAGDDRIFATRFDLSGHLIWSREVDAFRGYREVGNRAKFAMLTPADDILLAGYVGYNSYDGAKPGYAKFASNGDLQLAREIGVSTVVAFNRSLSGQRIIMATATGSADVDSLSVIELQNPANVLAPPMLESWSPADQAVVLGETLRLEALNLGSPATFSWFHARSNDVFHLLAGQHLATLTFASAAITNAGHYYAVASNSLGVVTSRTAAVSVITNAPVFISSLVVTGRVGEYFYYQPEAVPAPAAYVFDSLAYPDGVYASSYYGDITGTPSTTGRYEVLMSAGNALGTNTVTLVIFITRIDRTPYEQWVYDQFLSGDDALPGASPLGDGVANLLKYAFNMYWWETATTMTPGTGYYGLPDMRAAVTGGATRLRIEFVRRIADTNLAYQAQFSSSLSTNALWDTNSYQQVVTPINDDWERVIVFDQASGTAVTSRFSRMLIIQTEP